MNIIIFPVNNTRRHETGGRFYCLNNHLTITGQQNRPLVFSVLLSSVRELKDSLVSQSLSYGMAISMLNAGTSVNDVSEKCGFLSASAFSNSFKKNFGYSPTKMLL
ncbi:MAG: helix-turn-helix domain-containing protein [Clostridia bacterium]|nr:helix-turn-helix domain-containing protein [Clostridia bacterium]